MARLIDTPVVALTEDAAGKQIIYKRDEELAKQTIDAFERGASSIFNIAASANEDVSFGDVDDVRGFYIEADGDFDVIFNGGAETVSFKVADTTTGRKAKCRMDAQVTQINITNPDATNALTGSYCVWGDPTP